MMTIVAGAGVRDESLRELFTAHYAGLVGLAALVVDDRGVAEEVVQDAFVAAAANWERLDAERVLPYLRSSVLNGARDVLRRRGTVRRFLARMTERGDASVPGRSPPTAGMTESTEAAALAGTTRREVLEAVRRLPQTQRNVVLLRYFLDCSETQIAATLGVSAGTVKTSAHRALIKLAPALEALR